MPQIFLSPLGAHLWYPILVVFIMQGLAMFLWQFRQEPGARWQVYSQVSRMGWLVCLIFSDLSVDANGKIFWLLCYTALTYFTCFFWYQFAAGISGFALEVPKWVPYLFLTLMVICALLSGLSPWTKLYWKEIWVQNGHIWRTSGPLLLPIRYVGNLLNVISTLVNFRWILKSVGLRRRQAILFFWPSMFAWVSYFFVLIPHSGAVAMMPTNLLLGSLLTCWAFYRWRIYNLLPMAQEAVVKNTIDGLMLIDEEEHIVKMNTVARSIFAGTPVTEDAHYQSVVELWPDLLHFRVTSGKTSLETCMPNDPQGRFYLTTNAPLSTPSGHQLGQVLVFKDITIERQQQARILEQQAALSTMTERQRIGRELHDGPGQLWSFVTMQTDSARALIADQKFELAAKRLDRLADVLQDAHLGLRESIHSLQTTVTPDGGLLYALSEQLRWYKEHCELETDLQICSDWQEELISPEASAQSLRILQEALANVRKSSEATRVLVRIELLEHELHFLVQDNGRGFDIAILEDQTGHHGLKIMQERAAAVGARIKIDSQIGSGTNIHLYLPLSRS